MKPSRKTKATIEHEEVDPSKRTDSSVLHPLHPRRLLPTERRRRLRSNVIRAALPVVTQVLGRLPLPMALGLGRGLGGMLWKATRHRERSIENLAVAFPDWSRQKRTAVARASYVNGTLNLMECVHMYVRTRNRVLERVDVEGWDIAEAVLAEKRPIVVLTGHCGNWELMPAVACARGLTIVAVAQKMKEPALEETLQRFREKLGMETITRQGRSSVREFRKALSGNAALGVLIDQDTDVDGVWVPFFGRPAYTPLGPAKIALKYGALVVPVFIERLDGGKRHRMLVQPPIELPKDPVEATAAMSQPVEEHVRRCPEQWVWAHRRWRRQPG